MKIEKTKWRSLRLCITSGDGEDDKPEPEIVAHAFGWYVRIPFLPIVRPEQRMVESIA